MAVDKMQMLSVVAPLSNVHGVLQDMVLAGEVHIENYTSSNSPDSLTMSFIGSRLKSKLDIGSIQRMKFDRTDFKDYNEKLAFIAESIDLDLKIIKDIEKNYSFGQVANRIEEIYKVVRPIRESVEQISKEIEDKKDLMESIKFLDNTDIDISQIKNMKNINYHIGTLTKDNRIKLRDNYENISAVVLHIGSSEDGESYMVFSPARFEEETEKILKSLNFKEIQLPDNIKGNVNEVSGIIQQEIEELEKKSDEYKSVVRVINQGYTGELNQLYTEIHLEEKIEQMLENVAVTNNFFYFSGWVPSSGIDQLAQQLERDYEAIITLKDPADNAGKDIIPPTKLKNNWFVSPFEILVNMYGIPNYHEIDPTMFLGITYLILFGAMFGDVGQGLVLLLGGLLIKKKVKKDLEIKNYGEILFRLGFSSMFFGFMYGSIFGNEHLIPALFVRPLENINFVLATAVAFGICLLLISFGMSIYNLIHEKEYEEAFFGRNGIAGMSFYILLLATGAQMYTKKEIIPNSIMIGLIVISLLLLFLKTPVYAFITKTTPHYEDGIGNYFVEGGFDLIETMLSLLSNSISFIRIGAFALNHVGLFLAFATMAQIANNQVAGLLIMIIGNVIIIGLEGLIVLIQGLRLEYYELFSKYFKGDGREYMPIQLVDTEEVR